jgi:hypothetical protein
MSETQIQRQILDYLAARHILAFRQNTGAVASEYKGKKRFMRFGTPGMADVLAFPQISSWVYALGKQLIYEPKKAPEIANACIQVDSTVPLWLEVKAEKGKQSELQKSFQAQVESHGHRYAVVRSIEDVEALLK